MSDTKQSKTARARGAGEEPAYSTFPHVTTHGPRDRRCFHGKPEDWRRAGAKRSFGGKVK